MATLPEPEIDHGLALEAVVAHALQGLSGKVAQAVAGSLGTSQRTTKGQALAGEHAALEAVGQALVLAEQIANLTAADTDITGRAVHELADVAVQLGHKALAEAHDFHVALAVGVKVRAALAAAHGQGGEAVLEGLLKAQELQDALVDRGMEAQAALVGADGAVELHAVATVHLDLALIIDPGHTEGDDALGLHQTLDEGGLLVLGVLFHHGLDALQHLTHSLQEFRLVGIALCQAVVHALQVFIRQHSRILLFPNYSINFEKDEAALPATMRAGNRHRLREAPDFHSYTGSPQCRLLTLYYYRALPGDLQERKSRKCFKKTDEKLNPLHKTKNKTKNRCRTLFFKAAKECLLKQKRTGTNVPARGMRDHFFSSFSQASAAPSRYSPP